MSTATVGRGRPPREALDNPWRQNEGRPPASRSLEQAGAVGTRRAASVPGALRVFPGSKPGRPLSNMAMLELIK